MKVAVLTNLDKEISLTTRGGTELFVYLLVQELATRSEITQIDVYGVGMNHFKHPNIRFISVLDQPLAEFLAAHTSLNELSKTRSDFVSQFHLSVGLEMVKQLQSQVYDIIHDNSLSPSFMMLADQLVPPIISTLHTNCNSPSIVIPYELGILQKSKKHFFVPIAKHQEQYIKNNHLRIPVIAQIYNGYDLTAYEGQYRTPQSAPALWIGRISKKHDKGLQEALIATKNVRSSIEIIASRDDEVFFTEHITPYIHEDAQMIPQKTSMKEKNEWYQHGSFLLYPIMWEEPFPNVILETLASGTPVVAFARGSLVETINDGKNGFLVNPSDHDQRGNFHTKQSGVPGLCEAIDMLRRMSPDAYRHMRENCRKSVEEKFTAKRMADDYLRVYTQAITSVSSI